MFKQMIVIILLIAVALSVTGCCCCSPCRGYNYGSYYSMVGTDSSLTPADGAQGDDPAPASSI